MTTFTKEELVQAAEKIAEEAIKDVVKNYTASVEKGAKYYTELPDLDDFFAWIEDYDWGQK